MESKTPEREREKGLEGDFLRGERNCHIIRLVILSGGMRAWGRRREGGVAEARAGRIWQPVHDGGVSTKIINPQATEGGGSVVGFGGGVVGGWGGCREERYGEVRDCRGRRRGG